MLPHTSILEFSSLKRTRKWGGKVKTGCITCKARRIKCDEMKPHCKRCTSTGRKCDGYAQDRVFLLKNLIQNQASISRHTTSGFSGCGDDVHYLEFYHHSAASVLSNGFDDEFWSQITLQVAQAEPTVRHALIALSYLQRTEPGNIKHARTGLTLGHKHRTLLFHYNKSIRCLIDRIGEPSYVADIGLITCLLFVCIEFLRGNYHSAFTHFNSGLKILSEWQQGRLNGSLNKFQADQSSTTSNHFAGPTTMIEDTLIPLYNRAIAPALLFGVDIQEIFDIPCPKPENFQAQPFTTIREALTSSHGLRNPTILFVRTMAQKIILRQPITLQDIQYHEHLLRSHRAWFRAIKAFEEEKHLSNADKVTISSLKVGYYTMYILLAGALEVLQTPYDAYIDSFKALVHHAKIVLESMDLPGSPSTSLPTTHLASPPQSPDSAESEPLPQASPRAAANFTFDINLIPCLYFAAHRCRCPLTRREAISLLARGPPRECLWDAEQHVLVLNRVIEIEESEVDPATGWPVERTRLWCAVIDGNMDQNGGFWVTFALANWVQKGKSVENIGKRRRADAQWEEWFVIRGQHNPPHPPPSGTPEPWGIPHHVQRDPSVWLEHSLEATRDPDR